jgi:hypothetical protein
MVPAATDATIQLMLNEDHAYSRALKAVSTPAPAAAPAVPPVLAPPSSAAGVPAVDAPSSASASTDSAADSDPAALPAELLGWQLIFRGKEVRVRAH